MTAGLLSSLRRTTLFATLGATLLFAGAGSSAPLELGIDRSALSQQPGPVQQRTLSDIRSLGAVWFRDGPTSGSPRAVAAFVGELRQAKEQGLKVLVTIVQMDEDYDGPLAMNDHGWRSKALSRIDLPKFTRRLSTLMTAIKSAGLPLDAVEFGNEDDSYYYDADVPYDHRATPAEIHTWLKGYGEFLKAGAQVVRDPRFFPQAKIITFGMAHGCDTCAGSPRHLSDPASVVAMLKDVDGFDYLDNASYRVDGFGTHVYASPNDVEGSASAILGQDFAALGSAKPIWVTEWGFLDAKAFPNRRGQTLPQSIQLFLDTLATERRRMPMGPALFYRYDAWLADSSGKLLPAAAPFRAFAAKEHAAP